MADKQQWQVLAQPALDKLKSSQNPMGGEFLEEKSLALPFLGVDNSSPFLLICPGNDPQIFDSEFLSEKGACRMV